MCDFNNFSHQNTNGCCNVVSPLFLKLKVQTVFICNTLYFGFIRWYCFTHSPALSVEKGSEKGNYRLFFNLPSFGAMLAFYYKWITSYIDLFVAYVHSVFSLVSVRTHYTHSPITWYELNKSQVRVVRKDRLGSRD